MPSSIIGLILIIVGISFALYIGDHFHGAEAYTSYCASVLLVIGGVTIFNIQGDLNRERRYRR